jgi:hypothetical protein
MASNVTTVGEYSFACFEWSSVAKLAKSSTMAG